MRIRHLATVSAVALLGCVALGGTVAAAAPSKAELQSRLLTVSDLPAGWTATHTSSSGGGPEKSKCLAGLHKSPKGENKVTANFAASQGVPILDEGLAAGSKQLARYNTLKKVLATCKSVSFTTGGKRLHMTIGPLSVPRVATSSVAYVFSFTTTGQRVAFDIVLFKAKTIVGFLGYAALGAPDVTTVAAFAQEAAAKAQGQSVTAPPTATTPTTAAAS